MANDRRNQLNQKIGSTAEGVNVRSHAAATWTLPRLAQQVIQPVRMAERHPLIQLDRLSIPGNQEAQKRALDDVIQTAGDQGLLNDVSARRNQFLMDQFSRNDWRQSTSSPLTLHLARANALENAGVALHPLYGFAYLPASGLKGMARSAAMEMRWPIERVCMIFGNQPGEPNEAKQSSGAVRFHDAWPTRWPKLMVDIVNNHHPDYYGGKDAPGDWESPVPVYFLAIRPDTEFQFLVSARRHDTDPNLVLDAVKCLQRALSERGAGAKTAAGYGCFKPIDATPMLASPGHVTKTWALRLATPAFLAGAEQGQDDCDVRAASLRGQLRSWWRTLHAGCLNRDELRELESAIWGNTEQASAVSLQLERTKRPTVQLHNNPTERGSGLRYMAYGMDETSKGVRKQRWIAGTNGEWQLRVYVRSSHYGKQNQPIATEDVLSQIESAVWLLSQFGSIGSKGRKGFGSIALDGGLSIKSLDQAKSAAQKLRTDLKLINPFDPKRLESSTFLHSGTIVGAARITAMDANAAIETVGAAYASVAASYKHNKAKAALGLPRKLHGPKDEPLQHQRAASHQKPSFLDTDRRTQKRVEDARYSSPVHLHLQNVGSNAWQVNWVAFPSVDLPTLDGSASFLQDFCAAFESKLETASTASLGKSASPTKNTQSMQGFELTTVSVLSIVQAGSKQQYKVQEDGKPKPGMLVDGVPPDTPPNVGDQIAVYRITTSDPNSPRYRWDNKPPEPRKPSPNDRRGKR